MSLPLFKSCLLALLFIALESVLITIWDTGILTEEQCRMQAEMKIEALEMPVLLQKGLCKQACDEITEHLAAMPEIHSATWEMTIPDWKGPPENVDGWIELWRSKLPPRAVLKFTPNPLKFPYSPKISEGIQAVSGVAEILVPESELSEIQELIRHADTAGWLSRLVFISGGALLTAIILILATFVGQWPWHISPPITRLVVSTLGGIWGLMVAIWARYLIAPPIPSDRAVYPLILCLLVAVIIPNLLLPRGFNRIQRAPDEMEDEKYPARGRRSRRRESME